MMFLSSLHIMESYKPEKIWSDSQLFPYIPGNILRY